MPYLQEQVAKGEPLPTIARHFLGLFQGLPGARKWRQALSGKQSLTIAEIEDAAAQTLAFIAQQDAYQDSLEAQS
jgi:tRNA-dihydrouridine synthase A